MEDINIDFSKTRINGEFCDCEENILHLVIGEAIPDNVPKEFFLVKLYLRDEEDNLKLYANVSLPYSINYSVFFDVPNDPRYFFYESYDHETKSSRYSCEIKPLGYMKGVYRILNGKRIKIKTIEPLCALTETRFVGNDSEEFMSSFMEKLNNNEFSKDISLQSEQGFNPTDIAVRKELERYNELLASGILDVSTEDDIEKNNSSFVKKISIK